MINDQTAYELHRIALLRKACDDQLKNRQQVCLTDKHIKMLGNLVVNEDELLIYVARFCREKEQELLGILNQQSVGEAK